MAKLFNCSHPKSTPVLDQTRPALAVPFVRASMSLMIVLPGKSKVKTKNATASSSPHGLKDVRRYCDPAIFCAVHETDPIGPV